MDEVRATVIDCVNVQSMSVTKAGSGVHPNLRRFWVTTNIWSFREHNEYHTAKIERIQFGCGRGFFFHHWKKHVLRIWFWRTSQSDSEKSRKGALLNISLTWVSSPAPGTEWCVVVFTVLQHVSNCFDVKVWVFRRGFEVLFMWEKRKCLWRRKWRKLCEMCFSNREIDCCLFVSRFPLKMRSLS